MREAQSHAQCKMCHFGLMTVLLWRMKGCWTFLRMHSFQKYGRKANVLAAFFWGRCWCFRSKVAFKPINGKLPAIQVPWTRAGDTPSSHDLHIAAQMHCNSIPRMLGSKSRAIEILGSVPTEAIELTIGHWSMENGIAIRCHTGRGAGLEWRSMSQGTIFGTLEDEFAGFKRIHP